MGNIIVTTSHVEMITGLAEALIDHLTPKEPLNEFNKADQIPAMQLLSSNKQLYDGIIFILMVFHNGVLYNIAL